MRRTCFVIIIFALFIYFRVTDSNNKVELQEEKGVVGQIIRAYAKVSGECDSHDLTFVGYPISADVERSNDEKYIAALKKICDAPSPDIQGISIRAFYLTIKQGKSSWDIKVDRKTWNNAPIRKYCMLIEDYLDLATCKKK